MNISTPTHNNWLTHSFRAMGSQISVWLEADPNRAFDAMSQVEALFAKNEQTLSRFLLDSELNFVNGHFEQWTVVSDLLWGVLIEALNWAEATNSLFDPTILNALEIAGYTHSFEQLEMGGNSLPPRRSRGRFANAIAEKSCPTLEQWMAIRLDWDEQAVWLPQGIRIDLGGIAKGYTAQQAVELLSQWGPSLLNAGGDLTAGDAPADFPGWPVGLAAPWTDSEQPQEHLATLWLANSSLATSGIDYRRWERNGRFAHHLIDPRTGQPAQTDCLTTTVLAADAAEAEAWATAALILGSKRGYDVLAQHPRLAGAIMTTDEQLLLTPAMRRLTQI